MKNYTINGKVVNVELDDGRTVKIMTSYLEKMVSNLGIDMEEAVLTWLEDEGYLVNDEQEELCVAAKDNRVLASLHRNKDNGKERKKTTRTIKENPTKEMVIAEIANTVKAIEGATDIVIENKSKIITFNLNGEAFKIDLVQKRRPKNNE